MARAVPATPTQAATGPCQCGGVLRYEALESPWEFRYSCDKCWNGGIVSWAHAAAPPRFLGTPFQLMLWSAEPPHRM
jgi:hypothetical protein